MENQAEVLYFPSGKPQKVTQRQVIKKCQRYASSKTQKFSVPLVGCEKKKARGKFVRQFLNLTMGSKTQLSNSGLLKAPPPLQDLLVAVGQQQFSAT